MAPARIPSLIDGIAGDTVVGHSLCYIQGIETLTDRHPGASARLLRTIGLELERRANHPGDLVGRRGVTCSTF